MYIYVYICIYIYRYMYIYICILTYMTANIFHQLITVPTKGWILKSIAPPRNRKFCTVEGGSSQGPPLTVENRGGKGPVSNGAVQARVASGNLT